MKKWKKAMIALTAILALSVSGTCFAYGAESGEINVTGTGIVQADPDTAEISLSVETTGKTSQAAQKDSNRIIQKVTQTMLDMGVKKENIVTTYTSVYPTYEYDEKTGKRSINGYRSNTDLQVTTTDINNAGQYIDAALKAGATGTNGVNFSVSDQSIYYGQALRAAVKNAGKSAESIAAAYGKPLGEVKSVTETSRNAYYIENAKMSMVVTEEIAADTAGGSSGTTISYGKIQITANISVSYYF